LVVAFLFFRFAVRFRPPLLSFTVGVGSVLIFAEEYDEVVDPSVEFGSLDAVVCDDWSAGHLSADVDMVSFFTAIGSGVPCPLPLTPFDLFLLLPSQLSSDSPSLKFPAAGVGNRVATVRRFMPPWRPWCPGPPAPSLRVGVGVGVGNRVANFSLLCEEEPPIPLVRGADFGRAYSAPLSIEPEGGKVSEDDVETGSSINDGRDVLHKDVAGLKNANGVDKAAPES
jgi:hypothetical protein